MSGAYVSQLIPEIGFNLDPAAFASQLVLEIGYQEVDPGTIEVHATQLSTGSSWGTALDALRLHMERDQFIVMEDTPFEYSGSAGQRVIVNDIEDALIFDPIEVKTYQRVGEAVPFFSPTGIYWKIPEGVFVTGSLMVSVNGAVMIPVTDYAEQYAPSGTFEFVSSPQTGSIVVVGWGV